MHLGDARAAGRRVVGCPILHKKLPERRPSTSPVKLQAPLIGGGRFSAPASADQHSGLEPRTYQRSSLSSPFSRPKSSPCGCRHHGLQLEQTLRESHKHHQPPHRGTFHYNIRHHLALFHRAPRLAHTIPDLLRLRDMSEGRIPGLGHRPCFVLDHHRPHPG